MKNDNGHGDGTHESTSVAEGRSLGESVSWCHQAKKQAKRRRAGDKTRPTEEKISENIPYPERYHRTTYFGSPLLALGAPPLLPLRSARTSQAARRLLLPSSGLPATTHHTTHTPPHATTPRHHTADRCLYLFVILASRLSAGVPRLGGLSHSTTRGK